MTATNVRLSASISWIYLKSYGKYHHLKYIWNWERQEPSQAREISEGKIQVLPKSVFVWNLASGRLEEEQVTAQYLSWSYQRCTSSPFVCPWQWAKTPCSCHGAATTDPLPSPAGGPMAAGELKLLAHIHPLKRLNCSSVPYQHLNRRRYKLETQFQCQPATDHGLPPPVSALSHSAHSILQLWHVFVASEETNHNLTHGTFPSVCLQLKINQLGAGLL